MTITTQHLIALSPMLITGLTVVVVMLAIAWRRNHFASAAIAILGMLIALLSLYWVAPYAPIDATMLMRVDHFSLFYTALVLVSSIVTCIFAYPWLHGYPDNREEFYLLIVIAALGGVTLATANHLATLFIGIELLSLPLFGLIGYAYRQSRSLEASVKYMLLSAVASSFLLFGMALLYAGTGKLDFAALGANLTTSALPEPMLLLGFGMLIVGLCFKLSLVPFQLWTPDVYQGAPAPISMYLATVGKIAVFCLISRLFLTAPIANSETVRLVLGIIAFCSILFGNLLAVSQRNVKRMLAYSSIAHLGYLLVALIAVRYQALSLETIGVYLVGYLLSSIGSFGVVTLVSSPYSKGDNELISDYKGLFQAKPMLALSMTIMLLSLAGIPLTLGFIGKFYIIALGVQTSMWWLVGAVVVGSALGLYYYLRLMVNLYYRNDNQVSCQDGPCHCTKKLATAVIVVAAILVLVLGIYPQPLISLVSGAVL